MTWLVDKDQVNVNLVGIIHPVGDDLFNGKDWSGNVNDKDCVDSIWVEE